MSSEHNPIAALISQIQQKWNDEASPFTDEIKLFRWLIKPDEMRLFEGFLKLESNEHGSIPEVLVAMLTPFNSTSSYSGDLINDWIKNYEEDEKTKDKLKSKNISTDWDTNPFRKTDASSNNEQQLVNMLFSFHQKLIGKENKLLVALFPRSIGENEEFCFWLMTLLKCKIPKEITFLIFDFIGDDYFEKVCDKYPDLTKSLHVNLDLDGAVSKIVKSGNPNTVEYKLRECILEMGKAAQDNNLDKLNKWGQRALEVTQKSGIKSAFSSAYIIYAGMLFNFKKFNEIDTLLHQGLAITKKGLELNDEACKPLIIQYYGYMAASLQLQNKLKEAIIAYAKQGDVALEHQLNMMALMPYQQAYTLAKKQLPEQYPLFLQKAYEAGTQLSKEEQQSSNLQGIAYDYMQLLEEGNQIKEATEVNARMVEIFGIDWKESGETLSAFSLKSKQATA